MARWQFKIDLTPIWKKSTPLDTAVYIVERINALVPEIRKRKSDVYQDMADELENDILPLFEELVEVANNDADDFDLALESLYDWADTPLDNEWGGKKMCWICTIG